MTDLEWRTLIFSLVGKPFQWNGFGPDAYGCWGLCVEVYKSAGKTPPGEWMAESWTEVASVIQAEVTSSRWTSCTTPENLDIAVMGSRKVSHHVGIATPYGILNTTEGLGVVLESEQVLRRRYARVEYYRWVG